MYSSQLISFSTQRVLRGNTFCFSFTHTAALCLYATSTLFPTVYKTMDVQHLSACAKCATGICYTRGNAFFSHKLFSSPLFLASYMHRRNATTFQVRPWHRYKARGARVWLVFQARFERALKKKGARNTEASACNTEVWLAQQADALSLACHRKIAVYVTPSARIYAASCFPLTVGSCTTRAHANVCQQSVLALRFHLLLLKRALECLCIAGCFLR